MIQKASSLAVLQGYRYEEYLAEWRHLFGAAGAGTRHFWDENGRFGSVIVFRLNEEGFDQIRGNISQASSELDLLINELYLLL